MSLSPILASDTTAAFAKLAALAFWAGIGGGALLGIVGLVLLRFKRVPRTYGMILGTLSTAAGCVGVLFLFLGPTDPWVWAGVLGALAVGVLCVVLWARRAPAA